MPSHNHLRFPFCDDEPCPGCWTCVIWREDFTLWGFRPLLTGEVEPVSWTGGFALTAGVHTPPALPSMPSPAVEESVCEGFTLSGAFSVPSLYPHRELQTTTTGTIDMQCSVSSGYRVLMNHEILPPAGGGTINNVVWSYTIGNAKVIIYRYDNTNNRGISKLYVNGTLLALWTFDWQSSGGSMYGVFDLYAHSRTVSMFECDVNDYVLGSARPIAPLFAPCDASGTAIQFAVEENPDNCRINFSLLRVEHHNSDAANAALSCTNPEEPCQWTYCGTQCEDVARVQVDVPAYYCGGGSFVAVSFGKSAKGTLLDDGYHTWVYIDETFSDPIHNITVWRNTLSNSGSYTEHLRVFVGCATGVTFVNLDPTIEQPWAPDAVYCKYPLSGPIICECIQYFDFVCSDETWNAYACHTVFDSYTCVGCVIDVVSVSLLGC